MGTAGREVLDLPVPMDADIAAVTDRLKMLEV